MKKTGLVLAGILLALCVSGLVSPAKGQEPPAPEISLEINEVPVTTLNIPVCSEFTLDLWIRKIEDGWWMLKQNMRIEWDPDLMELVDEDHSMLDPRGWSGSGADGPGYSGYSAFGPSWTTDAVWGTYTFHCLGEGTGTILLTSPSPGTVLLYNGLTPYDTKPAPFQVTVHQYTRAVGGVVVPVNKLAVLSPYLALIGLVGAVTVAVAIRRRKP